MSDTPSRRWPRWLAYALVLCVFAGLTTGLLALLLNIQERKDEAREHFFRFEPLDENAIDPEIWRKTFPRQYDGYRRTVDTERTRHGGSEAFDKLEQDPILKRLYAGYAFSLDFREERGHAYMLSDQDSTERVKKKKQPGACLHCHSAVLPAYREKGNGDLMKGFQEVCAMDWPQARKLVTHPVTCLDCHDPKTAQLRVTRPGFLIGIQALARSDDTVPHLPSIDRWRQGQRKKDYDPNTEATRQEMRSFVCGQCHVEYYFKGTGTLLTYPWSKGLKVEQIESYYDEAGFNDWTHPQTGAALLKAQHPEFELWSQGIHARSGVSCADCHMPYQREGAIKISDHHVRSPLLNIARACQTCHRHSEAELLARAELIQERTKALVNRAGDALIDLVDAIQAAKARQVAPEELAAARTFHRKAQWRWDFVAAENSMGFHAPQESARILAEAIDYARKGQVSAVEKGR